MFKTRVSHVDESLSEMMGRASKQNLTVNQYNTASDLISDLEINIKKFLDQKQNKFFFIINSINVDTSSGKLRDTNTRPIDEIFEEIFHKALVNLPRHHEIAA